MGTGNSSKDFLGLGAIVDDATDVGTYGTLARATYTTLNATRTASGGTLTLAAISTLHSAITDGAQAPTLGLTTPAVWNFIEELIAPQERIIKNVGKVRDGIETESGFTGIFYRGVPIVVDRKCTSQNLFLVNEDYLNFYARPTIPFASPVPFKSKSIKGNDYSSVLGLGFHWSDWIKPSNSASVVGHVYLIGDLLSENPKRHGRLTGITGV